MLKFATQYQRLLFELGMYGVEETNARTGTRIKVGQPTSFNLDLSDNILPQCDLRKTYPKSAAAEIAWFLQGTQDVNFIRKYAPLWDDFVEADGNTVEAAYGYRWRSHFGRDQIYDALNALQDNPSDRRIMISAWDPALDGLGRPSKNVPCPAIFTLSQTAGRLNSTLLIRSSDVFVGLPYDVMGHALLMSAFAKSLQCHLGSMQVCLAHPHLYEPHYSQVDEALKHEGRMTPQQQMPAWSIDDIVFDPDLYVDLVAEDAKLQVKPAFSCKPKVVL